MTKKKKIIIGIIVVIIIGGVAASTFFGEEEGGVEFVTAERGEIIQEISVTGRVQPEIDVDLAFETSGKVSKVFKGVGDRVGAGDAIASLNNNELQADLLNANAQVRAAESKLEEIQLGSREEDIKIKESELAIAELDLANYYGDTERILRDAHNNADSALNEYIDDLFSSDNSSNPNITFTTTNQQAKTKAEGERFTAGVALSDLKTTIDTFPNEPTLIEEALSSGTDNMVAIESLLVITASALNGATGLSAATLASYKSDLTTARSNVNTELTSMEGHAQSINSAKAAVAKKENELSLILAGSTEQAIKTQIAVVDQAKANVSKIHAQITKTILRSPTSGIVTVQDAKVGEIVSANTTVTSVISDKEFEITANIVEADIANVKVGDAARLTLDAYGEDVVFMAHVIMKDPAETVQDGVTTYKTTFVFDEEDERIASGMTANLDVVTDKRMDAIMIPQKAVIFKDGKKIVRVVVGEGYEEREVEIGISGTYGNIEILSGIQEGDKIITSLNGN